MGDVTHLGKQAPETPTLTIGSSGLRRSGGWLYEEWHPKLSGGRAIKVYREMRDNDAVVGAVLHVVESLILQAPWRVEAAGEDPRQREAAKFLEECQVDMSHTWEDLLSEVLSMLTYGWAYLEVTYKARVGASGSPPSRYDDGKLGWRKIALRAQDTLESWDFDEDGGVRGLWQSAPPYYRRVFIPIEKALLFRTRSERNSPEGRSLLRNAYRSWWMLKRIQEIEAIGIERDLAGLPMLQVPAEIMHPNASAAEQTLRSSLEKLVQQIRRDEREGILIPTELDTEGKPTGYKLTLLSTGGRRAIDPSATVVRYEQRIAMTLLAQFLLMGMDKVGSFSLASSATDLFAVALGAILDRVEAVLNRYGVARLMALNGYPEQAWPRLVHGDVEAPPIEELAEAVNKLVGAGVLVPDAALEDHIREAANLPPADRAPEAPFVPPPGGDQEPSTPTRPTTPAAELALNGAQVQAAVDIVIRIRAGELTRDQGRAMLMGFFGLNAVTVEPMLPPVAG